MEIVEHLNDENTELGQRLTAAIAARDHNEHENGAMHERLLELENEIERLKVWSYVEACPAVLA